MQYCKYHKGYVEEYNYPYGCIHGDCDECSYYLDADWGDIAEDLAGAYVDVIEYCKEEDDDE